MSAGQRSGPEHGTPGTVDVDVVVVAYNVWEYVERCLRSVLGVAHTVRYQVYYVDNGSSDHSVELVATQFPQVQIIQNQENRGWGGGCNQGILAGTGRYVLLLNSDAEVHLGALDRSVAYLDQHPEYAALGGRVLNADGTLQWGNLCRAFPTVRSELLSLSYLDRLFPRHPVFAGYRMTHMTYDVITEVDQPTGAFLMVRRRAFETVGLFDEAYRMYYDDVDWSFRAHRAGWKQVFVPFVSVTHHGDRDGGQTVKRLGPDLVARRMCNKLRFFRKHRSVAAYLFVRLLVTVEVVTKLAAAMAAWGLGRQPDRMRKYTRGFARALRACCLFEFERRGFQFGEMPRSRGRHIGEASESCSAGQGMDHTILDLTNAKGT